MRLIITDEGRAMIAQALSEEKTITFTKIGIGKGTTATTSHTSLKSEVASIPIDTIERDGDTVRMSGVFSNSGITTSFRHTELGVFARLEGEAYDYIYSYGFSEPADADLIPAVAETAITATYNVAVYVGESATVNIVMSDEKYASKNDLTSHITNTQNPHGVTKEQIGLGNVPNLAPTNMTVTFYTTSTPSPITSGSTLALLFSKLSGAVSSLISHLAARNNPHQVTMGQVEHVTSDDDYAVMRVSGGEWVKSANDIIPVYIGASVVPVSQLPTDIGAPASVCSEAYDRLKKIHDDNLPFAMSVRVVESGKNRSISLNEVGISGNAYEVRGEYRYGGYRRYILVYVTKTAITGNITVGGNE